MKPVLILQHQLPENPAYLGTWLRSHSIAYEIINAGAGQTFPDSIQPYSALAVMGGGMSANDDLASNHQAIQLIRQAMFADIPVIGHCLGGQLMSKALGGSVTVCSQPEIGWQQISYTDSPLVHTWFGEHPAGTVIHWHYDTFSIPAGATLLASSPACANQAFAIGKHLAMQFHIEIDESKVESWVAEDDPLWESARANHKSVQSRDAILSGVNPYLMHHKNMANNIYTHWLSTTEWSGK